MGQGVLLKLTGEFFSDISLPKYSVKFGWETELKGVLTALDGLLDCPKLA